MKKSKQKDFNKNVSKDVKNTKPTKKNNEQS